jgi:tetraacyldisaccharide 4'-kinase
MHFWNHRGWAFFLWPVSVLYGLAVRARNWMYDRRLLSVHALDATVISIGNITVGGTGKTPFVQFVARLLSRKGLSVAVISRGYGGTEKGILTVSDGRSVLAGIDEAGDEPVLLAKSLPGVPVVVSRDRWKAGAFAIRRFGCKVLVCDDAFQHRGLGRNLDFVLLRAEKSFGNGWMLPAGPLREPPTGLGRADAVVVTGSKTDLERYESDVMSRCARGPVFFARHCPVEWIRHGTDESVELNRLKGLPVLAFAGIGNPKSFEHTVAQTGAVLSGWIPFPDHHRYREDDLRRLADAAGKTGSKAVVTTEKDGVRIKTWKGALPLYCLRIRMEADEGLEQMIDQIS